MQAFSATDDTICAISTPPGRGGIAVVRVSGPGAIAAVDAIWHGRPLSQASTHTAHFGTVADAAGGTLDQAVATVFRGPRSYTGEDVVEISVHGSPYIQRALLDALIGAGCRMAGPGEFTRRAFLNGRLDLAEAEAVADVIASSSRAAHRLAISQLQGQFSSHIQNLREQLIELASLLELELDFSEEDVEFADRSRLRALATEVKATVDSLASTFASGRALREGIPVAIVGRPNAGKSRLLNALLQADRAIVSDIPGTTRDTVEDTADIDGHTFRFIDTAGLRATDDPVETLGIARALDKVSHARAVIWLISPDETDDSESLSDFADSLRARLSPDALLLPVLNKIDTIPPSAIPGRLCHLSPYGDPIAISAARGDGLDTLSRRLVDHALAGLPADESLIVTNARHHQALLAASTALTTLLTGMPIQSAPQNGEASAEGTAWGEALAAGTENGAGCLTTDLLAYLLREAIDALSSITGQISSDTILTTIFTRFCVGK